MTSETCVDTLTRREARRQSRREAILDVAHRSFQEHGYAAATMNAIAAELGGSKGTLWSYFPSKEDLFAAVIDRATTEFRKQLSSTLLPGGRVDQAVRTFCRQFLSRILAPDAISLYRLVVSESARFPEVSRIFWERGPSETQKLLAGFLDNAMERGLLRKDDPLRAGRQLIGLCMGGCHQRLLMGMQTAVTPTDIEEDARAAYSTFMHGYAPD